MAEIDRVLPASDCAGSASDGFWRTIVDGRSCVDFETIPSTGVGSSIALRLVRYSRVRKRLGRTTRQVISQAREKP